MKLKIFLIIIILFILSGCYNQNLAELTLIQLETKNSNVTTGSFLSSASSYEGKFANFVIKHNNYLKFGKVPIQKCRFYEDVKTIDQSKLIITYETTVKNPPESIIDDVISYPVEYRCRFDFHIPSGSFSKFIIIN